ncbi:MAG: LytR/AlgR family response regulator transcription factor [Lachnotalea sp.]
MKIGIVDDERPARSELIYLLQLKINDAIFFEANSCHKALELLQLEKLDVIFVDIQLGDMNGTTLASLILEKQPDIIIVFATAYEEYAVKAFELGAIDYLLKPYSIERIDKCIRKVEQIRSLKNKKDINPISNIANKEKMILSLGECIKVIDICSIIYIQSFNRGCSIYTSELEFYQNQTLNFYDEKLKLFSFFRVHKSFLVNLRFIKELIPSYNNGYAIRLDYVKDLIIPIGRHQYRELRDYFEI